MFRYRSTILVQPNRNRDLAEKSRSFPAADTFTDQMRKLKEEGNTKIEHDRERRTIDIQKIVGDFDEINHSLDTAWRRRLSAVYGFVDLNEIESMIPCREYHRHLYEDAQEDLPFPFSWFLRRIARSLARPCSGEEHSPSLRIPRRPRILAPPRTPERDPSSRRLLLTRSSGLPTCHHRLSARIQFTSEPINYWHTYTHCPRQLPFRFNRAIRYRCRCARRDVGVIVCNVVISSDKYVAFYSRADEGDSSFVNVCLAFHKRAIFLQPGFWVIF